MIEFYVQEQEKVDEIGRALTTLLAEQGIRTVPRTAGQTKFSRISWDFILGQAKVGSYHYRCSTEFRVYECGLDMAAMPPEVYRTVIRKLSERFQEINDAMRV